MVAARVVVMAGVGVYMCMRVCVYTCVRLLARMCVCVYRYMPSSVRTCVHV